MLCFLMFYEQSSEGARLDNLISTRGGIYRPNLTQFQDCFPASLLRPNSSLSTILIPPRDGGSTLGLGQIKSPLLLTAKYAYSIPDYMQVWTSEKLVILNKNYI